MKPRQTRRHVWISAMRVGVDWRPDNDWQTQPSSKGGASAHPISTFHTLLVTARDAAHGQCDLCKRAPGPTQIGGRTIRVKRQGEKMITVTGFFSSLLLLPTGSLLLRNFYV